MSRIALVGNLSVDRVAGAEPRAGGGVFWAARAAAHIAADAAVATRCAAADRDVALAPLEAFGLPVFASDARRTTAFSFHYEGDRRVMTVDAVGDPWTRADVTGWAAGALDGAEWVYVAGLLRPDFPAETVSALAREGRRLLVDAHGIVRVGRTGPLVEDGDIERAVLAELTVLKLNEEEAKTLAGGLDAERLRSLGVAEVVLTLGSHGSVVVTRDSVAEIAASRVEGAIDPTGAGDAYSLVYVDARAQGAEPAEAGERASRVVAELIGR